MFENKSDWKDWKSGKYTPITIGYVNKDTFELGKCISSDANLRLRLTRRYNLDCKNLCEAHEKCYSCQGAFKLTFIRPSSDGFTSLLTRERGAVHLRALREDYRRCDLEG